MLYIDDLRNKIDQELLVRQQEVLSGLFFRLKKNHGSHNWKKCHCGMCIILKQHVYTKIQMQKVKKLCRWILDPEYNVVDDIYFNHGNIAYRFGQEKLDELKQKLVRNQKEMKEVI